MAQPQQLYETSVFYFGICRWQGKVIRSSDSGMFEAWENRSAKWHFIRDSRGGYNRAMTALTDRIFTLKSEGWKRLNEEESLMPVPSNADAVIKTFDTGQQTTPTGRRIILD